MKQSLDQRGSALIVGVIIGVVVIAGLAAAVILGSPKKADPNACVSKTLSSGSTGSCVSDAQHLVNWTAHGILGKEYIPITGTYDDATVSTVKIAQKNSSLPQTGTIDSATWKQLCGHVSSDAPSDVSTAAKQAGC